MIDERLAAELLTPVAEVVRQAAAAEIMPLFRGLADDQVAEKTGPHDLVTVADRRAEAHLTAALTALLPGSVVVGEEAVDADPTRYAALDGDRPVWIVDPIDGTRTFVRGGEGFSTLVALAHRGELLASWTYTPARDSMATAVRGGGALLDGRPLRAGSPAPGEPLEVACSNPVYSAGVPSRALLALRTDGVVTRSCAGSAGLEYLAVARGELDATAFAWESAWDHAAGLLLVAEAGGAHTTRTGRPFRLAGGNDLPFTAARDAATAERVRTLLAGGRAAPSRGA
ncbi:inositol monophosphatase family protein [Kitasatospora sp. NPDC054939]